MDETLLLSFYEVMTLSSSVLVAGQNYVLVETTSCAKWSGEVTMLRSMMIDEWSYSTSMN